MKPLRDSHIHVFALAWTGYGAPSSTHESTAYTTTEMAMRQVFMTCAPSLLLLISLHSDATVQDRATPMEISSPRYATSLTG